MSITKQIGKNTLGGGKGMEVRLHEYHRSSHNLSYAWRSTMTVGTLVPFMKLVALPGDTFEIQLDTKVLTHPTIGPLFGSYKLQMDIFSCPIRLYMAPLHNNALNVGMDMKKIKIPQLTITQDASNGNPSKNDPDPWKVINPSSILRYLGMQNQWSSVSALPLLSYIDIYKNYYVNKQEENSYALMGDVERLYNTTNKLIVDPTTPYKITGGSITVPTNSVKSEMNLRVYPSGQYYDMNDPNNFIISVSEGNTVYTVNQNSDMYGFFNGVFAGSVLAIKPYAITEFDDLREYLLGQSYNQVTFTEDQGGGCSYIKDILGKNTRNITNASQALSGLFIKTYQSDIFNNWVSTEWIDGENGINAITAIDTSSGSFTMDSLNLAKKVYDMLNRIAVSGGSYKDWIDTVYTSGYELHAETPIYEGGMSEEIEFQEVVSNSATQDEPLGTLAGRGMNNRGSRKGGTLKIKIKEPSYIIGIVSITPRIDYAEGVDWDIINLKTMDDLHKPAMDGIGYQDLQGKLITGWVNPSVAIGKQPAWINYMTNFNKVYGNFAMKNNEMFMTLVKQVEYSWNGNLLDPTKLKWSSYIEPQLYNYIFADSSLDAQNFWVQIGCGIRARRVMSAKQIPNL